MTRWPTILAAGVLTSAALSILHTPPADPPTPPPAPVPHQTAMVPPIPQRTRPAVTPSPPVSVPEPWASLADCESGLRDSGTPIPGSRRWDLDTGNGYHGGLQWALSTWQAVKPDGAPDDPAAATRWQQVQAGQTLLAQTWGGWHHWPACSRMLGLR